MTDLEKLLPCPFCGEKAHIDGTSWRSTDGKEVAWVTCKECGTYGPTRKVNASAAAWNARASDAALLVAEKALREVAMPIYAMTNRLSPGENLSGAVAVSLANDPEYLKRIARAALSEIAKMTGGGE